MIFSSRGNWGKLKCVPYLTTRVCFDFFSIPKRIRSTKMLTNHTGHQPVHAPKPFRKFLRPQHIGSVKLSAETSFPCSRRAIAVQDYFHCQTCTHTRGQGALLIPPGFLKSGEILLAATGVRILPENYLFSVAPKPFLRKCFSRSLISSTFQERSASSSMRLCHFSFWSLIDFHLVEQE